MELHLGLGRVICRRRSLPPYTRGQEKEGLQKDPINTPIYRR